MFLDQGFPLLSVTWTGYEADGLEVSHVRDVHGSIEAEEIKMDT
jgi:hypothetical protein